MKTISSVILLSIAILLSCSCVSRTTTSDNGYGGSKKEKGTVWIWQKEYREVK